MKTVKTSIGTVRRNTVKARLILFSVLAIALIVCSFFSEYLTPYDPYLQNLDIAKQAPTKAHPLGTDRYGRDMLSRVIVGSRTSIFSTLLLVAAVTVLGTAVGLCGGFFGGWADAVLMRISDIFLAFPGLVFALAVAGALGGGLHNAILALAAVSWPKYARLARSQTLARREAPWMQAARLSGSGTAFLEIDGSTVEYDLERGQSMIVDTGYLAAMDDTCTMEIVSVPGVKNKLFGGEGLFNTVVHGPGHIILQSMPISAVASCLSPFFPSGSD